MTELWKLENEIYAEGFELICGVDEAGRGPLAGPVCAAAVILPRGIEIAGLDDSKSSRIKSVRLCTMLSAKMPLPTASPLQALRR